MIESKPGWLYAFQHLLHQIDPPAWTFQFVPGQLIGRACGIAHATMYARPQGRGRDSAGLCVGEGPAYGSSHVKTLRRGVRD